MFDINIYINLYLSAIYLISLSMILFYKINQYKWKQHWPAPQSRWQHWFSVQAVCDYFLSATYKRLIKWNYNPFWAVGTAQGERLRLSSFECLNYLLEVFLCHFRALAYIQWHACGIYGSNVFTEQISKEKYVWINEYIAPEPDLYK